MHKETHKIDEIQNFQTKEAKKKTHHRTLTRSLNTSMSQKQIKYNAGSLHDPLAGVSDFRPVVVQEHEEPDLFDQQFKQRYLVREILEKRYNQHDFSEFLRKRKAEKPVHEALDINRYSFNELEEVVQLFQSVSQPEPTAKKAE